MLGAKKNSWLQSYYFPTGLLIVLMMETVMIILTITIMDMDYRVKKVLRAKKNSWLQSY